MIPPVVSPAAAAHRAGAAVVTGAAGGLGREIAAALHADGWPVLLTDLDGDAVAAAAVPLGGWSRALDVRDEAACAEVVAEAAGQGGLGLWVNNAGILVTGPSWEQDAATRRRVVEVNALGAMNGTLAALAVMRAQGHGHVLNVVSLAGLVAAPGETVYAASKHALVAFSIGTLADLRLAGHRGVHVSCLCPDGIWTPMLHDKLDDPQAAASFTGTLLDPARVARRAARLARRPRPVVSVPRWRGAQVRLLDALPGLALRLAPLVLAVGRAGQRRQRRRTGTGPR
ncbi:SDR family oxidoreductase [Micromonospora endolithica]|uniref:SDR family oxidoreductase n=1 Tax=Micromonospora endolithica TaxID=230091 RepID=A0A3A9ZJE1_9ACTN|nr:SDR family oxidoreductase [Micromonospora endolithica]RKN48349.1 SDR family oxidoreductase [Micromonospora endolithica]TWJ24588.1 NADP-dependent 3-hydroxy acid dehydrogenase YdfG [Micromonospora endolithica]